MFRSLQRKNLLKGLFYVAHEPTGVFENHSPVTPVKMKIDIYPNPIDGNQTQSKNIKIRIHTINDRPPLRVRIFDVLGQTVSEWYKSDLNGDHKYNFFWNTKNLYGIPVSSGIYFVQVFANSSVESNKLVVLR